MKNMVFERPNLGASLLPPASGKVFLRMHMFAGAINGLVDPMAAKRDPILTGCVVMPYAGIALAGTSTRRPLLFREGELLKEHSGLDIVLLRFDVERGASFDILSGALAHWLCRYVVWHDNGETWLVPEKGEGPYVHTTSYGLHFQDEPPFMDSAERDAAIMRAIESPSPAGRG